MSDGIGAAIKWVKQDRPVALKRLAAAGPFLETATRLQFAHELIVQALDRRDGRRVEGKEEAMITISLVLVAVAFLITVLASIGKAPLWIAVMLLVLVELLRLIPVG